MEPEGPALEPEALDALLRAELGRRLVVIGLTLGKPAPRDRDEAARAGPSGGLDATLGEPPLDLLAELARYGELWVRWLAPGMRVAEALARAAALDADALLIWMPSMAEATPGAEGTGAAGAAEAPWPLAAPRAVMGAADAEGLHDRAVLLLVGPGASRELARALGFDDGFGPDMSGARVATAAVEGALAAARLRRGGSSPPCYL